MNKQEIIDNLRIELRDKDFEIINLRAELKNALKYIKKIEARP